MNKVSKVWWLRVMNEPPAVRFVHLSGVADQPCTVFPEPHGGHAQPRRLGHEGEAVSHRSGDQDVGHRLLRHPEAVQRGDPQVSLPYDEKMFHRRCHKDGGPERWR